ncbi:MAG: type I restriction endonuclease [Oscillospiraceae bacterium]|nr:type I restriction endonuclease [Oscillospiraceae bacterium]
MDFIDELRQFSTRVSKVKDAIATEEATKNALILPFFQLLGYDIFNPLEFVPEFTADVGTKQGEKVDYAIVIDGEPVILIEAKWCGEPLDNDKHTSQLFRYFSATAAKFGILTNGINYRFFTDLNQANKMDLKPFLGFDVLDVHENIISELKRFAKKTLDLEAAFGAASELKYMGKIKDLLNTMRTEPSDSIAMYIMSEVYEGKRTQKAVDEFRPIIKRGFIQYINDAISETLKSAIKGQSDASKGNSEPIPTPTTENDAIEESETLITFEEIEAFAIVKSILRDMVDVDRLAYRHAKQYLAILFDDNKNKRVCRFWFSGNQKFITTPDENKKSVRHDISSLNDIYKYADFLREVCGRYL